MIMNTNSAAWMLIFGIFELSSALPDCPSLDIDGNVAPLDTCLNFFNGTTYRSVQFACNAAKNGIDRTTYLNTDCTGDGTIYQSYSSSELAASGYEYTCAGTADCAVILRINYMKTGVTTCSEDNIAAYLEGAIVDDYCYNINGTSFEYDCSSDKISNYTSLDCSGNPDFTFTFGDKSSECEYDEGADKYYYTEVIECSSCGLCCYNLYIIISCFIMISWNFI